MIIEISTGFFHICVHQQVDLNSTAVIERSGMIIVIEMWLLWVYVYENKLVIGPNFK